MRPLPMQLVHLRSEIRDNAVWLVEPFGQPDAMRRRPPHELLQDANR
jgi:hypothetical protein